MSVKHLAGDAAWQQATEAERQVLASVLKAMKQARSHPMRQQFLQSAIAVSIEASQQARLTPEFLRDRGDFEVTVKGLLQPEVLDTFAPDDPLAAARLKGHQVKHELLYEDAAPLTSPEVAELLHISRQAVDKRRRNGKLLGVSLGRRGYLYPAEQFTDGRTVSGLDKVLTALQAYSAWTQLMFLKTGDARLEDKTPLDCLRTGRIEDVVRVAESYGKHSAA